MSDQQKHNDPLEELFKKKAEEYDISFREEDWNSLEHKMDLRDARLAYRKKLSILAAASFILVALLGYFTFENHNRLNQLNDRLTNEMQIPGEIPPQEDQPPIAAENESRVTDSEGNDNVQSEDPTTDSAIDSPIVAAESDEAVENELNGSRLSVLSVNFKQLPIAETITGSVKNRLPSSVFEEIELTTPIASDLPDFSQTDPITSDIESGSTTRALSRISVGLLASPDLSTVGSLSNFERAGYKLGAVVEYSFSENLSVSVGLIQTRVNYSAHSHQYNAPVYWQGGNSPEHIYAECLLYDLPITLKLNVANFDRSRFFVTAGLSSYIMQSEDYYFSYRYDSPGQIEGWSGQTGTRHWFSNAGLSIGYEMDLHPQWSVRAEPFIKVPLQEVGWGNVKLYSLGSFISLNYRL